jgi:COMPASS component SWD1
MIRLYTPQKEKDGTETLEYKDRYIDQVNKNSWSHISFSSDGEFIVGGTPTINIIYFPLASASRLKHSMYIWDRLGGGLIKTLEGPAESIDYFDVLPPRIPDINRLVAST